MAWIFAYGSLMWRPGFEHDAAVRASLDGYHRAFTVPSTVRWGTPDTPAPTLGLEEGGSCEGLAYRPTDLDAALDYLREREGENFRLARCEVELEGGETAEAHVALRVDGAPSLADRSLEKRADLAARAEGEAGTGAEYVLETRDQVARCGIEDPHLEEFAELVEERA